MQEAAPRAGQPECSTSGRAHPGRQLLSVAPMMDWTDLHFRELARLVSARTWLWTEMVVDKTIIHTPQLDKHLWFPPEQHPIVLQLGGSDPATLREAAAMAAKYGYDEINLNCGCPSDRVAGAGCFGASLMLQPELVADCMAAVAEGAGPDTPVTVKCRLGVDEADSYEQLRTFVRVVSQRGGVQHFIVHSRKCYLQGLSPSENRTVPPLRHEWVWALKRDFPNLSFSLNGGLQTAHEAAAAVALDAAGLGPGAIEGVMIGRAAYNDPWGCLGDADRSVFGDDPEGPEAAGRPRSRREVISRYLDYADTMQARWGTKPDGHQDPSVRSLAKPLLNLFHGERGCKRWKQAMDAALKGSPESLRAVIEATLDAIPADVLDAPPKRRGPRAAAGFDWQGNRLQPEPPAEPTAAPEQAAVSEQPASGAEAPPQPGGVKQRQQCQLQMPAYAVGELPVTGDERAGIHQGPPEEAAKEMKEAKKRYLQALPGAGRKNKREKTDSGSSGNGGTDGSMNGGSAPEAAAAAAPQAIACQAAAS